MIKIVYNVLLFVVFFDHGKGYPKAGRVVAHKGKIGLHKTVMQTEFILTLMSLNQKTYIFCFSVLPVRIANIIINVISEWFKQFYLVYVTWCLVY